MDDVAFLLPVPIGALLRLTAQVKTFSDRTLTNRAPATFPTDPASSYPTRVGTQSITQPAV